MLFQTQHFLAFLIAILLAIITACNGQKPTGQISTNSKEQGHNIGNKVKAMDDQLMIVYQDKKNNYWFGSLAKGVYRYDGHQIIQLTTADGLSSNQIVAIQEDKNGNIYFDTPKGVNQFDGHQIKTLQVVEYDAEKQRNQWKLEPENLWFHGDWDKNGPYRFDGQKLYHLELPRHDLEDLFHTKFPNAPYSPYGIYTIYKDQKGHLWFGTASFGVCRFDGQTISWLLDETLFEMDDGPSFGIRAIIEDPKGYFWFSNIIYRYSIAHDTQAENGSVSYRAMRGLTPEKDDKGLKFTHFMSAVTTNNEIWMATYDQGVWRHNEAGLTHFPVKVSEKDITLFSIYKDNQEQLWLGTHNNGAYQFNGHSFEKFDPLKY